jgi:hypothetical protein
MSKEIYGSGGVKVALGDKKATRIESRGDMKTIT